MTRNDYNFLAEELRVFYNRLENLGDEGSSARIEFGAFLSRLCTAMRKDNPNFVPSKFRDEVYR